jgi:hypothetical protein
MLKHYRKKSQSNSEAVVISDDREDSDEPEYETVDYSGPTLKLESPEEKLRDPLPRSNNTESPDKEVHKKKLFGKQTLLRKETMLELQMKLKSRDDAVETAATAPANEVSILQVHSIHYFVPFQIKKILATMNFKNIYNSWIKVLLKTKPTYCKLMYF